MRIAIRLFGLDIVDLDISTDSVDADAIEAYGAVDSTPVAAGFSPSTPWTDDVEE